MKKTLKMLAMCAMLAGGLAGCATGGAEGTAGGRGNAPTGWELRNGMWLPVVAPGTGTPEAQVAQMIVDLHAGNSRTVIEDAKDW